MKGDPNIFTTSFFGIFIVITVGLFFSFTQNNPTLTVVFSAMAGAIFALVQRFRDARPTEEMPTLSIVIRDYRFRSFSAIGFLSITYALSQGVLFGFVSGLMIYALRCIMNWQPPYAVFINSSSQLSAVLSCLALSLVSLFLVGVCRVSAESYILIFKVAQKYLSTKWLNYR